MNHLLKLLFKKTAVFAVAISVLLPSCASTILQNSYSSQSFYASSRADVEKALFEAGRSKGWKVYKEGKKLFGELNVRSHFIKVEFVYDTQKIRARYVDSRNMKYNGHSIHKKYYNFLRNFFKKAIAHLS